MNRTDILESTSTNKFIIFIYIYMHYDIGTVCGAMDMHTRTIIK
jgi:hypothetical protein